MRGNYLQTFLNDARQDLQNIVFNDTNLIIIRNSIAEWLKKKQALDINIKHRYEMALKSKDLRNIIQENGEADLSRKGMNALIKKYIKGRNQVEELTTREDIVQLFRDGYELIHRIRESFVGREITYRIQYTSGTTHKQGKLLEAHLTLEQLLPAISLRWEDQSNVKHKNELTNAGVLFLTNSKIKKVVESLKNNEKILEDYNVEISGEKKDLWDSMVTVRNKMVADDTLNKYSFNFGRLYEVYNLFTRTKEYQTIDTIHKPPKKNTEALFISRLNSATHDHIPGWQSGDLGWDQLKSVFNSSAGLIGNSSIEKTLKDLQDALLKDHKNEMSKALKSILTSPDGIVFDTKIDKLAKEEAVAAIDARIQNLKNID